MQKKYSPKTKQDNEFRAKKSLGQNFLTDIFAIEEIVEGSFIKEGDLVIEIGPGQGALTTEIAEAAGHVIAIELDKSVIPILRTNLLAKGLLDKVEIRNEDILKADLHAMIREAGYTSAKVIGNLPYYITSPIILKLLEDRLPLTSITVMMQREVADRVTAQPGSKAYGVLSVEVQYYADAVRVLDVDRTSFTPSPNVDSTVLRLDLLAEPRVKPLSESDFFRVVKAGFGERRKTLRNSLTLLELEKDETDRLLEEAGIDGVRRAETLTLSEFCRIADCYTKCRKETL